MTDKVSYMSDVYLHSDFRIRLLCLRFEFPNIHAIVIAIPYPPGTKQSYSLL